MKKSLFTLITTLISVSLLAQAPKKSFTEKLDGIKTTSKELVKNAGTDKSSIGQTGQLTTSVPLVTVSSRTMQFPLELRYAAGIKASQQSGSVGLGWALPLGSITRDYGAYEPDYTSTSHEASMKSTISQSLDGDLSSMNGTTMHPEDYGQSLGYSGVHLTSATVPLSDKYHVQVPGALTNTFFNGGGVNAAHDWKLEDVENWKISHSVKTYQISQEFSRINECNLYQHPTTHQMGLNSSYASAIGVYPYVINGYAKIATAGSESFIPAEEERFVRYEDFESFVITDDNGTRYVFGRALRGQKYVFSDDPYWSNHNNGSPDAPNPGSFWKVDYIAEWLLTEIQSADYVDLNGNDIADDGDAGDWIRFEYTAPTKMEETTFIGQTHGKMSQMVPTHREWSNFSQTDRASSLMRELAYLTKIVTPVQEIDLTISERYDVDHDYYSKPANRVGSSYYYENRTYTSQGSSTDFDIEYPVETMKYDSIMVTSRLINKHLYPNESNSIATIALNYAAKGSPQELAVSSYLIRNNNKQEKTLNGQPIGLPSSSTVFNAENYYSETEKRGKTTLLGIDFYGASVHADEKNSYAFEYAYNPGYDEIHKREIARAYYFPSLRQGSSSQNTPIPNNKAEVPVDYIEKRLGVDGITYSNVSHTGNSKISPYEFLIDFPYKEKMYKFQATNQEIHDYVSDQLTGPDYPLINTEITHPLQPTIDVFGYLGGSTEAAKAWSLTKITYPTGGEVSFEYESGNFTTSASWNIQSTTLPVISQYNALAKARSFVQDAYNREFATVYTPYQFPPKNLTATYEVELSTAYGIRLKKKSINDRLNPVVVTTYEYTEGQLTALPSEYMQNVYSGFNQFITRENHRLGLEYGDYLANAVPEMNFSHDYDMYMRQCSHTNIAFDNYSATYFYSSIKTVFPDNSYSKTFYGSLNGSIDYPQYHLYAYRLATPDLEGRYTLAGNNININPIVIKSEALYKAGTTLPYQKTDFTYTRYNAGTIHSMYMDYTGGQQIPNEEVLWNGSFPIYIPDVQSVVTYVGLSGLYVLDVLKLPFPGTNAYSYQRWGQFKTLMTKKTTTYKGLIAHQEMTYDQAAGFVLREEKSYTQNEPNIYLTQYQYAHEFYNGQTLKFENRNLKRLPCRTTTYLGTVAPANALSATVMTYDLTLDVPKPLDTYTYETAVDASTGTYTLPVFNPASSNWRISESDVYLYNKAASPIHTRSNQLYNKTVTGNGMNTVKAQFSSPDRPFDATYTGFEDLSVSKHTSDWTSTSYMEEEWLTPEESVFSETAVITTSGSNVICNNNSYFDLFGNQSMHAVTFDNTQGMAVGDEIELSFTYSNTNYNLTSYIASLHDDTELPAGVQNIALAKVACFTSVAPIPAGNPFVGGTFTNVTLKKVLKNYRLSSAYSRTGNYSYKLPTIRQQGETAKKTPIRPVKIEAMPTDPGCSDPTIPAQQCFWDYQASIWLRYDFDIVSSSQTLPSYSGTSEDLEADQLYRRGQLNPTTQGFKIVCDIWNATRTQVIDQKVFYPKSVNASWKQYTVDIPILKGQQQWVDVYVVNETSQLNTGFTSLKSLFIDDIIICPANAKYGYTVVDKFGSATCMVDNNDVFTQAVFDHKGRVKSRHNAYGKIFSEVSYFDQPNWLTSHNYITERNWVANGSYFDTRYYLDGFGKTKQAILSDVVRGTRMVSETNIYDNRGRVTQSWKPYALSGHALSAKYDGAFTDKTSALYGSGFAYTSVTFENIPEEKISTLSEPRMANEAAITSSQSDYVNTSQLVVPSYVTSFTYPLGTLIVHEKVNQLGKKVKTYIDNLGRVIMEEHEIGNNHQQNADGSITVLNSGYAVARTWFKYDGAGRIVATFDPDGKKTEYIYNSLGLVVKTISPDKGTSEMRYDKYGQVRFVKNARDIEAVQNNIYGTDQFKYLKYDKWGRVIETGVLTVAPNTLDESTQNPPFPTTHFFDDYTYVNNQNFPTDQQPFVQVHVSTVYDGQRALYQSNSLLTQITYSNHSLSTSDFLYTAGATDMQQYIPAADGQPIRTRYQYAGLTGSHDIKISYNPYRIPISKTYVSSVSSQYSFTWNTELDNLGRSKKFSTIYGVTTTQHAFNYFDATGQLLLTGVGTGAGGAGTYMDYQSVKKNIRDQVVSSMSQFFRVGLTYNAAGNITSQTWSNERIEQQLGTPLNMNRYNYYYDDMHRLTGADYKQVTMASNPFTYYNTLTANVPTDFNCFVNESDVFQTLQPLYDEIDVNGIEYERAKDASGALGFLQATYVSNNQPYQTMTTRQKSDFLDYYIDEALDNGYDPAALETYKALVAGDNSYADSIGKYGIKAVSKKYHISILGSLPFSAPQDCFSNPASTVYGYLPDFVNPTFATNQTKYDAAYWYSGNGNISQLNRNDQNGTKTVQAYTYGNALSNRLSSVSWTIGNNTPFNHSYTYDATGNILTDPRNQVTGVTYSAYDDMPTRIVDNNSTQEYRYFGGQRSVKILTASDREYFIDEVILTQTGTVKSYQTQNGYAVPNTSNGVDYFYYVKDWLGTPRAVVAANGTVVNALDVYPYGKKLPGRHIFTSNYEGYRYQFTGHEMDGETGYQYHGARYYNEELGRYMSVDPWANKYPSWSTYNYVMGNPMMLVDPSGKGPTDWVKNIETGEYIWDNTVTNQFQAHEGQKYIGKEDIDIVKDMFGSTSFSESTWDVGLMGSDDVNDGKGGAGFYNGTIHTLLSITLSPNVENKYDQSGNLLSKKFTGITFNATISSWLDAAIPFSLTSNGNPHDWTLQDVNFTLNGEKMTKMYPSSYIAPGGNMGGAQFYSKTISANTFESNFGKSFYYSFKLSGLYGGDSGFLRQIGAAGLFTSNYTYIDKLIKFTNK